MRIDQYFSLFYEASFRMTTQQEVAPREEVLSSQTSFFSLSACELFKPAGNCWANISEVSHWSYVLRAPHVNKTSRFQLQRSNFYLDLEVELRFTVRHLVLSYTGNLNTGDTLGFSHHGGDG